MTQSDPAAPERNLLRALNPGTIEIHKALQRLLLQSGGRYGLAPHYHDWDYSPYVISWPFKDLRARAVLVFPWDQGTGQSLADFCRYYKLEIPRRAPQTIVVTSTPLSDQDRAAAEAVLESPIALLHVVGGDPNKLDWLGPQPEPQAVTVLDDESLRKELRQIDPGEVAETFHQRQPKDPARAIESNLLAPRRPSYIISYALIAINVVMYVIGLYYHFTQTRIFDSVADTFISRFWLSEAVAGGESWRLLTCGFIHIGIFHLAMNMFFLYQVGPLTESTLGRNRFLILYMLSLFGCSLLSFFWHFSGIGAPVPSAGASGALMGIYFGLTGYVLAVRKVLGRSLVRQIVSSALRFAVIMAVMGLFLNVDNAGHLGGGLVGLAVGYAYGLHPKLHPPLLVKFRWVLLVLFLSMFVGLAAGSWPHARALAVGPSGIAQRQAEFAELSRLESRLKSAIDSNRASPELLQDWDKFQALWISFRDNPGFQIFHNQDPNFATAMAGVEQEILDYRRKLCMIAVQALTARRLYLLQWVPVEDSQVELPAEAPNDEVARVAQNFVIKVRALTAWQGCQPERDADPDLDREIAALEATAAQAARWSAPAAQPGAPADAAVDDIPGAIPEDATTVPAP